MLRQGATDNEDNVQSEIFSIGLTVIAAGILESPESVYNLKNFTFDKAAADDLIGRWKS